MISEQICITFVHSALRGGSKADYPAVHCCTACFSLPCIALHSIANPVRTNMDDFLRGRNRKTASQIIAEAKASISPEGGGGGGGGKKKSGGGGGGGGGGGPFQQRMLSTKRPFTPRCAERSAGSRPLSTGLSVHRGHGALMIVEESDDDIAATLKLAPLNQADSNSRKADLLQRSQSARLPALVPPAASTGSRQQFRRPSSSNRSAKLDHTAPRPVNDDGHLGHHGQHSAVDVDPIARLIFKLQASQDDANTAIVLEQLSENPKVDLVRHRKDLMTIAARHLTSDNTRILFPLVELLLLLTREQGSKTLIILASKIIFKLSRDDANDNAFLSRRVLDLLLTALGHHCPRRDHEAFMYAYGGLKFLTLNGKITAYLSDSLGFLHLCMLHTKVTRNF